jgi:CIC family chloride channel protein
MFPRLSHKILWNPRVLRLSAVSLMAGLLTGIVGGLFRLLLAAADHLRSTFAVWTHARPYIGWLGPVTMGLACAALARLLVARLSPAAEGSGVQRVEAVFSGEIQPAGAMILPVKFIGGLLAIGSGLALGREGPTVQMGSSLAVLVARLLHKNEEDTRILDAAGAGAGLAVAFNAPIGGSIFVFEELALSFTPALLVATLAAASVAVWVARSMLGNQFDFVVQRVTLTATWKILPFLMLGALLGVVGTLYNRVIVVLLRFMDRSSRLTSVQRAACVGATIGLVAWFAPPLVGGGDNLTQAVLSGRYTTEGLTIIFALRFFLGPWSYAAGTPGGLFGPMLVLGASFGALFGDLLNHISPNLGVSAIACAVVGMGTLFSACVRAPLTGIVLTVEMTGRGDLTLALLSASLVAIVTTMLLNGHPIYETLKHRMLDRQAVVQQNVTASQAGSAPD